METRKREMLALTGEELRQMAPEYLRSRPDVLARFLAELPVIEALQATTGAAWRLPSVDELAWEFRTEYAISSISTLLQDSSPFSSRAGSEEFFARHALSMAEQATLQPEDVRALAELEYADVPNVRDLANLFWLVSNYGVPKDLVRIASGIIEGDALPMPILVREKGGQLRAGGGRTRMAAARALGLPVTVLIVDLPKLTMGRVEASRSAFHDRIGRIAEEADSDLRRALQRWSDLSVESFLAACAAGEEFVPQPPPEGLSKFARREAEQALRLLVRM